ncbi:hypothetical protein V6N13_056864 [Hibiscus sabdariffa]
MLARLLTIWGFLWWLEDGASWLLFRASNAGGVPPFGGGPPAHTDPTKAHDPDSDPMAPAVAAFVAQTPSVPVAAMDAENLHGPLAPSKAADLVEETIDDAFLDPENSETAAVRSAPEDAPYDPMVHTETSNMMEKALEISRDCVLLADLTGLV